MGKGKVYLHSFFSLGERCIIKGNFLIISACHVLVVITVKPCRTTT